MKALQGGSIRSTFRVIQGLVGLLLIFLVVQGVLLWRICGQGARATTALEREGIPSLTQVGTLRQNLNLYRLHSYELMFIPENERPTKAALADALHREDLELLARLQRVFPAGEGRRLVAELESSLTNYVATLHRLRAKLDKDFTAAMQMLDQEVPPQVRRLNDAATKLQDYCNGFATDRVAQTVGGFARIKQSVLSFGSANIVSAALVVGLVTFSSVRIRRKLAALVRRLTEGADQVHQSAGSVSNASQSLAEGAGEQAASLEETSSSLEEMSSMTQRNAENARRVKELGGQARLAGDVGVRDMAEMTTAMQAIQASSEDIAKIIKTIDEIAFQTNILALNAAVEAARAGVAGMGFAVVAGEVRNLAQRAAQAAKETAAKIEDAVHKSAHGAAISAKVARSLEEIVGKARQVDELASEVASASQEQSQGISQVNAAVSEMDKVTQSNAASAEESASAAQELNAQAAGLNRAVAELLVLVGTQPAAGDPPAPPAPASRAAPVPHPTDSVSSPSPATRRAAALVPVAAGETSPPSNGGDFREF